MSYYITRKFLEAIFGINPLMFGLPIVEQVNQKGFPIQLKSYLNPR